MPASRAPRNVFATWSGRVWAAIIRIDRLGGEGSDPYGIPEDNPFVGNPEAADEVWEYGLRHPQHF